MNIKSLLTCFLVITFCSQGFSQKIKYKDLIVLLQAKQYDQAEIYLKKYLRDNTDNPNAYLYMGLIYQDKAAKFDMLKETRELVTNLDSAVYFYDKAYKGITEKELSRNEDYYQIYNRRDLRTGKFGVKLSDVQLDLEGRLKLKDRGTTILTMKTQLLAAQNSYSRAQRHFREIQNKYESAKELYLRSDDKLISDFSLLIQVYDSCHMNFNDYKATAESLGKTGYNQDLDPEEIRDFKKDGLTVADFYKDDLKLWDYKRWAVGSIEIIEKEMSPLRDRLVAADGEINKLHQTLKKDSISVAAEIGVLRKKIAFPELLKIDANPMPLRVFELKLSELDYGSQVADDHHIKDSLRLSLHVTAVTKELLLAKKVDSLAGILSTMNLEAESENYKHFVTKAYGASNVLAEMIRGTKGAAEHQKAKKEMELAKLTESLRWIVNGTDSIPLFKEVTATSKFKPVVVEEEKYTVGIQYADSIGTGYLYTIQPSRKLAIKCVYPVEKQAFKKRNFPFVKSLVTTDEKGLVFFVLLYSEAKIKAKIPATLVKIYKQEGLAWSINYNFDQLPAEIIFSSETFDLAVKTKSSLGEFFSITFDKTGKVVK